MDDLDKICNYFLEEMREYGGNSVRSIVLYGSALGQEFRPGISDYNFLVVADSFPLEMLGRLAPRSSKWNKRRITVPILMTLDMVRLSLDSYPLEFLSIKSRYKVLQGEDVLKNLVFEKPDVRLQCERELKSKLLLFRRSYLEAGGHGPRLHHLVARGLPSLVAIFRGMLFLKDGPWSAQGPELWAACEKHLGLQDHLLQDLYELRQLRGKPSRDVLIRQLGQVLNLLQGLVQEVDRW